MLVCRGADEWRERGLLLACFECGCGSCGFPLLSFLLESARPLQLLLPLTLVRMSGIELVSLMFIQHMVKIDHV